MKQIHSIITCIILCMIMLLLNSCKDTDYRKACEEHDFQKAYNIVLNLDENQEEAKRYVVLQEAMYVLEEYGEAGIMRISAITKENKAYWLPAELLDFVRISGNSSLIESLEQLEANCGNSLKLETSSISGIAQGFFEVVFQDKYTLEEEEGFGKKICVRVKYTKNIPTKIINEWKKEAKTHSLGNPGISFGYDLLDNNGTVIDSEENSDGIEIKDIENMSIGDTQTLWMYIFSKETAERARKFRISTKLEV